MEGYRSVDGPEAVGELATAGFIHAQEDATNTRS